MLQADVTAARWQQDSDGAWLCLRVQSLGRQWPCRDELQPDKQYVAQIKRKGRSLDANAYAWVLLDKLAAHYGIPRNDVYREEIKTIGGVSDVLCIVSKAADESAENGNPRERAGWPSKGRAKFPAA